MKRWKQETALIRHAARSLAFILAAGLLLGGAVAEAQIMNPAMSHSIKQKHIYRGSLVVYENIFSARALDVGAEQSFDPYYAQSLTFMPQIWLRDDMFLRARLSTEVEITDSEMTDVVREPWLSDLTLTYMWLGAYKIPLLGIGVHPSVRLRLPTSKPSQAASMMFALEPGVMLSRGFKLHSGKYFNRLTLMYAFRFAARFHEFQTAQVDIPCYAGSAGAVTGALERPECTTSGQPNTKFRLINSFIARVAAHPKVFITLSVALIRDMLYELSAGDRETVSGAIVPVGGSRKNTRDLVSASLDVTVPVAPWLFLSLGFSSFHNQLEPGSDYYAPLFNRFTNIYFDMTFPIDKLVDSMSGLWGGA